MQRNLYITLLITYTAVWSDSALGTDAESLAVSVDGQIEYVKLLRAKNDVGCALRKHTPEELASPIGKGILGIAMAFQGDRMQDWPGPARVPCGGRQPHPAYIERVD